MGQYVFGLSYIHIYIDIYIYIYSKLPLNIAPPLFAHAKQKKVILHILSLKSLTSVRLKICKFVKLL